MILITGASGLAGGQVLAHALAQGLTPKAMYRTAQEAAQAPAGATPVIADYANPPTLQAALEGIETVYLVCGPIPQLVAYETAMLTACKNAGVRHIVLNSALGAGDWPKSFPSWHHQVEQNLAASGIAHTIIRPNGFMQNIVTYNAQTIRTQHAFYAAMGDARTSLIDVRDVAAVVAAILAKPSHHAGKTYELNGPEAVTNAEIADRITRVTGTPVSYVEIPEEAQRQAMLGAGMPEWQVTAILELQEYYRTGRCATVDETVASVTGRPPRTLDAYLEENAAAFKG
jgi:uncharacterized protein YbjT (DUF2867 family)